MYRTINRFAPARLMFAADTTEGGAGTPTDTEGTAGQSTAGDAPKDQHDPDPEGAEALGDKGKQALDRMKAERKAAQDEARKLREEFDAFKAKAEGKEKEFAAEQERRKVESEALAKANERILKAEVRAAAAGRLADPADALRFIDLSAFEVGADGDVDTAAVNAAIADLAKAKPYLAAQGGNPGTVFESPGAHRKESAGQVTKAELGRMTPDQINAARAEGRLNDLLGIKS